MNRAQAKSKPPPKARWAAICVEHRQFVSPQGFCTMCSGKASGTDDVTVLCALGNEVLDNPPELAEGDDCPYCHGTVGEGCYCDLLCEFCGTQVRYCHCGGEEGELAELIEQADELRDEISEKEKELRDIEREIDALKNKLTERQPAARVAPPVEPGAMLEQSEETVNESCH